MFGGGAVGVEREGVWGTAAQQTPLTVTPSTPARSILYSVSRVSLAGSMISSATARCSSWPRSSSRLSARKPGTPKLLGEMVW